MMNTSVVLGWSVVWAVSVSQLHPEMESVTHYMSVALGWCVAQTVLVNLLYHQEETATATQCVSQA